MSIGPVLRRHWPEALLVLALALPWLGLLALGMLWLWQSGLVWAWAIAAALLSALAWWAPWLARRWANWKTNKRAVVPQTDLDSTLSLNCSTRERGDWSTREREAWGKVVAIAREVSAFSFMDLEEPVAVARRALEAVARHFHPEHEDAWAQFTLPDAMLLAEQVSRDLRAALLATPFARQVTLGRGMLVWRYGTRLWAAWRAGYPFWRVARAFFNPMMAFPQEAKEWLTDKVFITFADRMRAHVTQEFVLSVGRASIDLYSGRLRLSSDELNAAAAADSAGQDTSFAPVRIVLGGQVNAGKSSLVNALAREVRCALGPVPTTTRSTEYRIERHGLAAVSIVDTPGVGTGAEQELRTQVERADLILWVASATQPARSPDRQAVDDFRARARAQLGPRPPRVVLALTHIDELRPANEWRPPYDLRTSAGPKAQSIRAAIHSVGSTLDLPTDAIVPVAMPPNRHPYNVDALWARIAVDLDEARLVQLDRLRIGGQRVNLRELANQLGRAGRFIIEGVVKG